MTTNGRWGRDYGSYREFYEATYGHAIIEGRSVGSANASALYCRQGAGDWSDAPTPDLVIAMQRGTTASGMIDLGAGKIRMSPARNNGIVVPINVGTQILMDQPHDVLALGIPFAGLHQLLPGALPADGDFGLVHSRELIDPFVFIVLERLWTECDTGNPHGHLFAEGALIALAAALLRLSRLPATKASAAGGLAPWQIRRATEAMTELLAENITLTRLAHEVGLSPFHFSRAFKQSLGAPPHRYRTRMRLNEACRLLETTDHSVTDIALQVGYESSQALARVFMRDLGITPTNWRRQRRR